MVLTDKLLNTCLKFFLPAFFAVTIGIGIFSLTLKPEKEEEIKNNAIRELSFFLSTPLEEVLILPHPFSKKSFSYKIADSEELATLTKALRRVDQKSISGHSGPIFECLLVLNTKNGKLRYLATVHKFEASDLYITKYIPTTNNDRYESGPPSMIRVPDLGKWIISKAPKANLTD